MINFLTKKQKQCNRESKQIWDIWTTTCQKQNKTHRSKTKQNKSKHRASIIKKKKNSRLIMDLYIKQKTINFLEDIIEENLDG